MTDAGGAPIPTEVRRARVAVASLFFTNAVLYANLVPRLPDLRDALGLSNSALGAALGAAPAGALAAGWFAPALIRRFGSARLASIGLVGLAATLFGVGLADRWLVLAGVLFAMGALDGVIDVAQNAHGFRVQRRYGRSIVNAFHGMWSIGAVTGGLMGAAAAGLDVPLSWHFGAVAVVFSVVALVALRHLLPGFEDAERLHTEAATPPAAAPSVVAEQPRSTPHPTIAAAPVGRPLIVLVALGVLSIAAAVVEDAGASWSAIYLRDERAAGAALAGLGFVAMQAAMTLGRFSGDRLVDRYGQAAVARTGGALIVVGMGIALVVPSVALSLVGFAAAGLGVATLVPAAMHAADELAGLPAGVGLTAVSWTLRVGFLASPPIVGAIADAASLRLALAGVPLAGITIVLLAGTLRPRGPAVASQSTEPPPPSA
jgi:MFS family permease